MARLNFSDYNFDSLVAQLRAIVKTKDAWKDVSVESGTGNFLIELFSYVAEMLMYYLERRAQESYIDTAQLRSSLVRLVSLLDYRPARQASSLGQLTFTLPGGWHNYDIYLPKGTILETAAGMQFIISKSAVLRRGETTVLVDGIQGVLVPLAVTSDGSPSQEVLINDVNVENSGNALAPTIRVVIDNEEWLLVTTFAYSNDDSKVFMQETQLDGTVKLRFGNGVFGKIPALNSVINIEYIQTNGVDGNVYSTGQITTISSVVYDSQGTDVTSLLTVTNSSLFLGGDAAETAEEIRRNGPLVFKTGQRAVTREDYIAILEDMPGIQTAYVWGERDETPPNITYFNKVRIACLLQDWTLPDNAFKLQIEDLLKSKEQLTVWLDFVDPDIVDTILDIELKVIETYQNSQIVTNVATALDNEFALGTGVRIGVPVRGADVIQTIENVVGVQYSHLTISHREILGVGDSGLTVFNKGGDPLFLIPLIAGTVKIYKDAALIAADNGLGVITGTGVTGTVNYTTGLISVTISTPPGTGEIIYAYYQQDEQGDIVVGNKQIARLIQKNITLL